jgi:hypothetical protein
MSSADVPDGVSTEVARLAAHVDELAAGLARLTAELEDLSAAVLPDEFAGSVHDETGSTAPSDGTVPVYARLEDWVTAYFLPTFWALPA